MKAVGTGNSSDKMDPGEVKGAFPRARLSDSVLFINFLVAMTDT